jgi:hypothetical protein
VHFALADCIACPLKPMCTKAANGKWGRSLTLLPREQQQILEERRAEQQTDVWKERYDVRAGWRAPSPRPSAAPTPSAKRRLKKRRCKEARRAKDINHKITKHVVPRRNAPVAGSPWKT